MSCCGKKYRKRREKLRYDNARDLKNKIKIKIVFKSSDYMSDLQNNAVNIFRRYHTSHVRYDEFKTFIQEIQK